MKQGSTLFLKALIIIIGIIVLTLCVLIFPIMWRSENLDYLPIFLTFQLSVIPFFFALYQTFKLLTYVDKNIAFSNLSIQALKLIKYSSIAFGALYTICLPYIYYKGDVDDAPGPIPVALLFIGAAVVITTFTAVLQKVVQNGVDLKSENDLTV